MTTEQKTFIENIAAAARKHAANYGIAVISPIIAQAINESGWGKSTLAAKYHNYFGMKCGSAWKGKSVNMSTCEEYEAELLKQTAEENQTRKILAILEESESLEDAKEKVKALLNK